MNATLADPPACVAAQAHAVASATRASQQHPPRVAPPPRATLRRAVPPRHESAPPRRVDVRRRHDVRLHRAVLCAHNLLSVCQERLESAMRSSLAHDLRIRVLRDRCVSRNASRRVRNSQSHAPGRRTGFQHGGHRTRHFGIAHRKTQCMLLSLARRCTHLLTRSSLRRACRMCLMAVACGCICMRSRVAPIISNHASNLPSTPIRAVPSGFDLKDLTS